MSENEKLPHGRPTIFNQEIADRICELTARHPFGQKKLCKLYPELPNPDTINEWRYKFDSFSVQYMKAKTAQAQLLAEEVMDIADDATNDWMETLPDDEKPMGWKLNGEHVQRSKLRIDARKWHASKLVPKIYGNLGEEQKEHEESLIEKLSKRIKDK